MNGPRSIKRNEAVDPVAKAKRDRAEADATAEEIAEAEAEKFFNEHFIFIPVGF